MKLVNRNHYFLFLTIAGLVYFSYFLLYRVDTVKSEESRESFSSATVFVHGFKGTHRSFDTMLNRFQNEYDWGKHALICTVTKDGRLLVSEKSSFQPDEHIFIQVIFENNRASFQDTSYWLSEVMYMVKQTYHIPEVNIVGHSMGGLVSTIFLENYGDNPDFPHVEKLVTIGSPFLGVSNPAYLGNNYGAAKYDLMPDSPALKKIFAMRQQFPAKTAAYAIASTGDQVVSVNSAFGLKEIISENLYIESVVDDEQISHSGLHESPKVDRLIGSFLWGK